MTIRRTVFLWAGLPALWLASAAPLPARADDVDGHWRLAGNPYRSRIEVRITADSLSAAVGCTSLGLELDTRAVQTSRPQGIVFEAPCFDEERRDRAANTYWTHIAGRIASVRTLRRKGSRLVLTSEDGRRLTFVRATR